MFLGVLKFIFEKALNLFKSTRDIYKMAPVATKRRRVEDEVRPKKKVKKVKKQTTYHSSSEDEDDVDQPKIRPASDAPKPIIDVKTFSAVNVLPIQSAEARHVEKAKIPTKSILRARSAKSNGSESVPNVEEEDEDESDQSDDDQLAINTALNGGVSLAADSDQEEDVGDAQNESDEDDEDEDEDDEFDIASVSETSMTSSQAARARKKRNDPTAFATSMSKILDTKLSNAKRADPVLSRSRSAAEANREIADSKLEQKARAQIRAEKKAVSEKGRVKDVLGLDTPDVDTGGLMEEEKRLKKMAQRGVVKLFNAVRAAQVKGEEAMRQARSEGVVGMQKREERVNEMSKQGFLDLISSGGKKSAAVAS